MQLVKLRKKHDPKESGLDGAFIMQNKEIQRIKGIRKAILLREK